MTSLAFLMTLSFLGMALEAEIVATGPVHQLESSRAICERLDAEIEKFNLPGFGPEVKSRIFQDLKANGALRAADRLPLQVLSEVLRKITKNDSLIIERVADHLMRSRFALPLAQATRDYSVLDLEGKEGLSERARLYLDMVMSPRIAFFDDLLEGSSRRIRSDIQETMGAFQQDMNSSFPHLSDTQVRAVVLILEAGIRKFGNNDRTFYDFARWITKSPAVVQGIEKQIKELWFANNTFSRRALRWINGRVGAPIVTLISLGILASAGMETSHELVNPQIPGWSEQYEFTKQHLELRVDWVAGKCLEVVKQLIR